MLQGFPSNSWVAINELQVMLEIKLQGEAISIRPVKIFVFRIAFEKNL
jgi:hypothetical protein